MKPDTNLEANEALAASDTPEDDWIEMLRVWSSSDLGTDQAAADLYTEVQRRARINLRRERRDFSLSVTDLVHDGLLRLSQERVVWSNQDQFCAAASRTMRRVLVDYARARRAQKRPGVHVELHESLAATSTRPADVMAVDGAGYAGRASGPPGHAPVLCGLDARRGRLHAGDFAPDGEQRLAVGSCLARAAAGVGPVQTNRWRQGSGSGSGACNRLGDYSPAWDFPVCDEHPAVDDDSDRRDSGRQPRGGSKHNSQNHRA